MALTINTNISSMIAQRSLNNATNALNQSIERMTTGYKINHASDNAAGYSISNMWVTQIGSLDIAADNAATGADLLTTAEETYSLLTSHLQRIRDLTEQAANGTFGTQSLRAIQSEIAARLQEVSRIASNSEFNGIKLMAYDPTKSAAENAWTGIKASGIDLQVGLYANSYSQINLATSLFSDATVKGLFESMKSKTCTTVTSQTLGGILTAAGIGSSDLNSAEGIKAFAAACSGLKYSVEGGKDKYEAQTADNCEPKLMLEFLDAAINDISGRVTSIGSAQNRVSSALTALDVQSQNLTASLSTLRDTDIASESSTYLQAQILQQASATLLSTANQMPSVALNLI
ncbi:MAG: hypothetical protein MJ231_03150 [bacterium]|nr:hypothetical protein [bacterium]